MKLNKMKREELEVLSYTDLTEMILKENKKAMNTASIFRKICDLLELSDDDYENKIGDFYTSLSTDKRFILLKNAEWDLKEKHKVVIVLDDDDEEDDYVDEDMDEDEENLDEEENQDESIEITDDEVDLDDDEDDLEDLSIVDEDEMEEEI